MGQFLEKIFNSILPKKEKKILMLGLDAAGKTTILYQLKLHKYLQTVPTIGFNVEQVEFQNFKFTIWDIGGQWKLRQLWYYYFQDNSALIYVIDSTDKERIQEAKEVLDLILSNQEIKDIPVLVLANKQDISTLTVMEITEILQLNDFKGVSNWLVQGCSAVNMVGIYEGLDWLSKEINKQK